MYSASSAALTGVLGVESCISVEAISMAFAVKLRSTKNTDANPQARGGIRAVSK